MNQSPYMRAYEAGIKLARLEHFSKHSNEGGDESSVYDTVKNYFSSSGDEYYSPATRDFDSGLGAVGRGLNYVGDGISNFFTIPEAGGGEPPRVLQPTPAATQAPRVDPSNVDQYQRAEQDAIAAERAEQDAIAAERAAQTRARYQNALGQANESANRYYAAQASDYLRPAYESARNYLFPQAAEQTPAAQNTSPSIEELGAPLATPEPFAEEDRIRDFVLSRRSQSTPSDTLQDQALDYLRPAYESARNYLFPQAAEQTPAAQNTSPRIEERGAPPQSTPSDTIQDPTGGGRAPRRLTYGAGLNEDPVNQPNYGYQAMVQGDGGGMQQAASDARFRINRGDTNYRKVLDRFKAEYGGGQNDAFEGIGYRQFAQAMGNRGLRVGDSFNANDVMQRLNQFRQGRSASGSGSPQTYGALATQNARGNTVNRASLDQMQAAAQRRMQAQAPANVNPFGGLRGAGPQRPAPAPKPTSTPKKPEYNPLAGMTPDKDQSSALRGMGLRQGR